MSTQRPSRRKFKALKGVKVVDLFCGVGGLTHGLVLEGFNVAAGVDNDASCKHSFEHNNASTFIERDIVKFSARDLAKLYDGASIRVLVGCAPCQPYSPLGNRQLSEREARKQWRPLYRFMRLISSVKPEIISMENVPDLSKVEKYPVFSTFLRILKKEGYWTSYQTVDASRYGVPQRRKRLVLLASRLGPIEMIGETHTEENLCTVRDAIGLLPPLNDGAVDPVDPLHRSSKLSALNKKRIISTPKDGGSAKSWKWNLIPKCYRRESGKSYMASVYGRMRWNEPSPTMTTHCTTLGTGRFGHPSQNRAISLREAATLQSFPTYYEFSPPSELSITRVARQIGNAVPVVLGRAIGKSLRKHISQHV